jgi:hypothetical protein
LLATSRVLQKVYNSLQQEVQKLHSVSKQTSGAHIFSFD